MTHDYVQHPCYQYQQNNKRTTDICKKAPSASLTSPKSTSRSTSLYKIVSIWMQRSRQRKQLAQLDKHLLDDIGLTEEMVAKEIAKPFWK